jgi:deoxyribodipyrimidine photo-lyase
VREKALIAFAKKNKKQLVIVHNHLLDVPLSVLPGGKDTAYTKFTPYFNAFSHHYKPTIVNSHKAVSKFIKGQKTKGSISPKDIHQYYDPDTVTDIVGGRDEALIILKSLNDYRNYKKERDYPSITNGTTRLSAYNKFGCVSPREVFIAIVKKLGAKHDLLKQMIWREFYYNIAVSYPHTTQGASLREEYDNIKWSYDKALIRAWKQGTTGYPIVDAGMRQLNQTGYMHNRLRMITASFLIKHLQIDWRVGEKYFAQKLTDYDPIINNGNWQWVAGCGADAQPYFRIFNPELQEKKFDRNREFINTYVTDELEPIVEYKDATARTVKMYKKGLYGGAARPHNPPAGL